MNAGSPDFGVHALHLSVTLFLYLLYQANKKIPVLSIKSLLPYSLLNLVIWHKVSALYSCGEEEPELSSQNNRESNPDSP